MRSRQFEDHCFSYKPLLIQGLGLEIKELSQFEPFLQKTSASKWNHVVLILSDDTLPQVIRQAEGPARHQAQRISTASRRRTGQTLARLSARIPRFSEEVAAVFNQVLERLYESK